MEKGEKETKTPAVRGGVYEFYENDGTYKGKLCLVVSNNDRAYNGIVSILILSSNLDNVGRDCVDVPISDSEARVARCGLVTYCHRSNLGKQLYRVSAYTMRCVDAQIKVELGFTKRKLQGVFGVEPDPDYKQLYEELLDKITKSGR